MIVTPGNRGTKFGLQACPRYLQAYALLRLVHVRDPGSNYRERTLSSLSSFQQKMLQTVHEVLSFWLLVLNAANLGNNC